MEPGGINVYKINNGHHHPNWLDFFCRIEAHNQYFPSTAYALTGFTIRDQNIAAILKQPVIAFERSATTEEIKQDLELRGFRFNSINDTIDEENGIILRDLHVENVVLARHGNIIYIDPIIQFTKDSKFCSEFNDNLPGLHWQQL